MTTAGVVFGMVIPLGPALLSPSWSSAVVLLLARHRIEPARSDDARVGMSGE
ncbi:hypothetical protein IA539_03995 [Gordonia sp. zg691]|uniref:hypothetical protein n=1 Tax=Gordonia jinghuaiqii TaxID=2758710 RepID=UPI001662712A|nr:hypothetical protein [Gordonia jinghuaiqii]MBD0860371.1 hypothetical protein [Gordonia jinghuaiqii]